ncbi:DinB family protein [Streptomonospora algeriensis]|uniref:DinB family protein n=1 Tax=Streptomonospora algeriensis TaxID=995084 RepID=A0ABW3BHK1_9ACTN
MDDFERPMPPLNADERTNLESWLDFYRTTLDIKCAGLTDEQLRDASAAPSPMTLLGLVQHMAEVERSWFGGVLVGEETTPLFTSPADPEGRRQGFDLSGGAGFETARTIWRDEIARARANCAARSLEDTAPFMGGEVSLRWIYTHMIAEYARHDGHADLIRERIDGTTGV